MSSEHGTSKMARVFWDYLGFLIVCIVFLGLLFLTEGMFNEDSIATQERWLPYFSTKAIKIVSFAFILIQIRYWGKGIDLNSSAARSQTRWGNIVFWITLSVCVLGLFEVGVFVFDRLEWYEKKSFLYMQVFYLLPIVSLAVANTALLKSSPSKCGGLCRFRRFLFIVDIPIILASLVIFALTFFALFKLGSDPRQLSLMLSGALTFLVFAAYCIERVLHHELDLVPAEVLKEDNPVGDEEQEDA